MKALGKALLQITILLLTFVPALIIAFALLSYTFGYRLANAFADL